MYIYVYIRIYIYNLVPRGAKVSAIDVTAQTMHERLVWFQEGNHTKGCQGKGLGRTLCHHALGAHPPTISHCCSFSEYSILVRKGPPPKKFNYFKPGVKITSACTLDTDRERESARETESETKSETESETES